jgi:outer membrane immunogenic protein
MRTLVLAIVAVAAFGGSPVRADEPPAVRWTGLYAGGQIGYGWSSSSFTLNNGNNVDETFSFGPTSLVGGGHVGVQNQWANWVLGIEAAYNWANFNQTDPSIMLPGHLRSLNVHDMGSVVAKAGYAWDRWLVYAKGGWAETNIGTYGVDPATSIFGQTNNWQGGWTLGGGVDFKIAPRWVAGIDFNYYSFKFDEPGLNSNGSVAYWYSTGANIYAVTARLSFLFDWTR